MTDTPEKIGLIQDNRLGHKRFKINLDHGDDATAYIRADIHEAAVAAAYEAAAALVDCSCDAVSDRTEVLNAKTDMERWVTCSLDLCGALEAREIRALTPADARAALEAVKRAEYERGVRDAAAAVENAGYYCLPPNDETGSLPDQIEHSIDGILALLDTPEQERGE